MKEIEVCIAEILQKEISIEWMRVEMFHTEDIYRNIPMLVFRIDKSCKPELIECLKKCIDDFQGNVKWAVFKNPLSRRGNYILSLSVMEKMRKACLENDMRYNEKQYFGEEKFELYCEQAVEDIPLLAKHIEKSFKTKQIEEN